jgi:hypothetical protein
MQIATTQTSQATAAHGRPVLTIDGVDKASNQSAPMRVFARESLGRYNGYGSLQTALSAARNLSRGGERPAVVVERLAQGEYQVFDAVWQYFWAVGGPSREMPMRHFRFEDGTASQYTAWRGDSRVEVTAKNYSRSYDGVTRWLVDGSRVAEITSAGGRLV